MQRTGEHVPSKLHLMKFFADCSIKMETFLWRWMLLIYSLHLDLLYLCRMKDTHLKQRAVLLQFLLDLLDFWSINLSRSFTDILKDNTNIYPVRCSTLSRTKRTMLPLALMALYSSSGVNSSTFRGCSLLFLSAVRTSKGLSAASWGKVDFSSSTKSASCRPRGHFRWWGGYLLYTEKKQRSSNSQAGSYPWDKHNKQYADCTNINKKKRDSSPYKLLLH